MYMLPPLEAVPAAINIRTAVASHYCGDTAKWERAPL